MAITLGEKKIVNNIESVVNGSIRTIQAVRNIEFARRESEFQKAINSGMNYDAQIDFRKKQLEEAKASPFSDEEYTLRIENSLSERKSLARLEKLRNKYKESLDAYGSNKESIDGHIDILNDILSKEQDPTFRQEVLDQLSSAHQKKNLIELNAIKNRAIVAEKDTSIPLIEKSISDVQTRRALASINKNDDEVAMLDDTLVSLKGAKSKLQIESSENEITFQSNRKNLKSNDKLGLLNNYIESSDISTPITYNGVSYPSVKAYWENRRNDYIAKDYFGEVQKELDAETAKIAETSPFGQIPIARIDAVNNFYKNVAQRPEFAPYKDVLEQQRVDAVHKVATDLQTALAEEAQALVGKGAVTEEQATTKQDKAFIEIENRTGIKLSRPPTDKEIAAKKTITETVLKDVKTPVKEPIKPKTFDAKQTSELNAAAERQRLGTSVGIKDKQNLDYAAKLGFVPSTIQSTQQPTTEQKPATTTPTEPQVATPTQVQTQTPTQTQKPVANNIYIVKPGDTLSGIAKNQLGDESKAFSLKSDKGETYDETTAKKLQIGTKLILPK